MDFAKTYTMAQWLLFFYTYCFIGWVWECCYVSVRIHKWTNRGFMHGPLLPIYGSGAITMLFCTLPVKSNPILVFIVALISATILELVTGTVMESLFKVRYWDYTRYKINYKGHICLLASLLWGTAGVIITYFVNRPIEAMILRIPLNVSDLLAFGITFVAACDFGASFREAMDMREMLIRLQDEAERQIKRLEKRVDVMAAVYGDEIEKSAERMAEKGREFKEKLVDIKNSSQEYAQDSIEQLLLKVESLPDNQKKKLRRYLDANPDAESGYRHISELLGALKQKRDVIFDKAQAIKEGLIVERKED